MRETHRYDVAIIGAGLAGLSLARQLLLDSDKKIILIDKRAEVPPARQKVGEATVQLSAYYFAKVLDLEEYLLQNHFMKYNLRFYWKTASRSNRNFEDYSQAYIRSLSNIASYQLDRNEIERELLRLDLTDPNFDFIAPARELKVSLSEIGPHLLSFRHDDRWVDVEADWVVDTSGREKVLARTLGLARANPIRHGSSFCWVEGVVNVEKLTDLSPREIRLKKDRRHLGHLPVFLATNHFCGEGFWFWVIPLHQKTSLGLVYDTAVISPEEVSTPQKLIEWVCREFPLFARDLPHRKIVSQGSFRSFSYDCAQTISPRRWALSGEAGRFTDPLYSPGGDLISIHNTLITDAILTRDPEELSTKCRLYEQMMKAVYEAYVPSYAASYDALGDQETMTLKYSWELAVYFSFYVFPFINDLLTEPRFTVSVLRRFGRLGPLNRSLQKFISAFYQWKKENVRPARGPVFNDFFDIGPLRQAERCFYEVGVSVEEARQIIDSQIASLEEMARFIIAHISAVVATDERALTNRHFVEGIDAARAVFDQAEICARWEECAESEELYEWSFDPRVLSRFSDAPRAEGGAINERLRPVDRAGVHARFA